MDILLVLGSVTAREYGRLRREMVDRGLNPMVIRITEDLEKIIGNITSQVAQGDEHFPTEEAADAEIKLRFKHFILYKLDGLNLRDVKAVIFAEKDPLEDDGYERLLASQILAGRPTYTVRRLENKFFELEGSGYGTLLAS